MGTRVTSRNAEGVGRPWSGSLTAIRPLDERLRGRYGGFRLRVDAAIEAALGARAEADVGGRSVLVTGVDAPMLAVASRLAISFADGGRETVLVDGDLRGGRSPVVDFDVSGESRGLADWLAVADPSALPTMISRLPHLSVIHRGETQADGRDLFRGDRLTVLLGQLADRYDRVVWSAPPVAVAPESGPITRAVDGVVLVVVPSRTRRADAIRARDAVLAAGGRLLGLALDEDP